MNQKYFIISSLAVIYFCLVIFIDTNENVTSFVSVFRWRVGYDKPCNETLLCNPLSWLSCDPQTNKCVCARPNEMIYNHSRRKCVTLIGERCKYGFDEEEDGYGFENPWNGTVADCVQGAKCINGTCSQVKNYGGTCVMGSECDKDKLLDCVLGVCQCNPKIAVYNAESYNYETTPHKDWFRGARVPSGICVGRVGTECSFSSEKYCSNNSYCADEPNTCKCMTGYKETSQKLCALGFNRQCSDTDICSDNFRCSSERSKPALYPDATYDQKLSCQCPHPKYQLYDFSYQVCRGYVGMTCDRNDTFSCVESAICNCSSTELCSCECRKGYVETVDRMCEVRHGFDCAFVNGKVSRSKSCDRLADLRCKSGKCSCEDDEDIYEHDRRKCSTPVGVMCENSGQCVENAGCWKRNGNVGKRCECEPGFNVTTSRSCARIREVVQEITRSDDEEASN